MHLVTLEKSSFLSLIPFVHPSPHLRTRLPLNKDQFPQRFKLQSCGLSPPDDYYPIAHTCFFSLELPRYSSLEICKEKLRYAVFNCQAIDGDDTDVGIAAAEMGWEDDD